MKSYDYANRYGLEEISRDRRVYDSDWIDHPELVEARKLRQHP